MDKDNIVMNIVFDTQNSSVQLTIAEARNLYGKLREIFDPDERKKSWRQAPELLGSPQTWEVSTVALKPTIKKSPAKKATRKKAAKR